jgi:NAD(P)H-hydrate epimerase
MKNRQEDITMKLAASSQMRELDRRAIEERGIPSVDLMERAAEGVAEAALSLLPRRPGRCRAAVFCGSGNNGGDGIAAARLLFLEGVRVRVFLVGEYEKLTPDAWTMTGRLSECGVELEPFAPEDDGQRRWALTCDVVIDAVFGVGLSRPIVPDSVFAVAIDWMNRSAGKVVAADIASGVEADTGRILGCAAKADRTISFTLPKIGQFVGDGVLCSGAVTVWDIGIPADLVGQTACSAFSIEQTAVPALLPRRKPDGHKGDFGKVLIVGGTVGYTGAPYLAAAAAVRTGCGLVYVGVPESIWPAEAAKCVSAMPFPLPEKQGVLSYKALQKIQEKLAPCDVLALGPGLGRGGQVTRLVLELLERTEQPVVLDADGINALAGHIDVLDRRRGRVTVLTPHDGEFARLGGDLSHGDRCKAARDFAVAHGCILVLKGHRTVTAAPTGRLLVNTTGNAGLAKGGSGDVLTGMLASLLAQGTETPDWTAACGVWLHGRAGDLAAERLTEYAMTPMDAVETLPEVFRLLDTRS